MEALKDGALGKMKALRIIRLMRLLKLMLVCVALCCTSDRIECGQLAWGGERARQRGSASRPHSRSSTLEWDGGWFNHPQGTYVVTLQ